MAKILHLLLLALLGKFIKDNTPNLHWKHLYNAILKIWYYIQASFVVVLAILLITKLTKRTDTTAKIVFSVLMIVGLILWIGYSYKALKGKLLTIKK